MRPRLADWLNPRLVAAGERVQELADNPNAAELALPMPQHFGYLLLALAALAVASGLYKFLCPELVREYSYNRWVRELKNPAIEYYAATYSLKATRYICGALYFVGGLYTVSYLTMRVWEVLRILLA